MKFRSAFLFFFGLIPIVSFSSSCNSKISAVSLDLQNKKELNKYELIELNLEEKKQIINRIKYINKNFINTHIKNEYTSNLTEIQEIIKAMTNRLNENNNIELEKLNKQLNTSFSHLMDKYNNYINYNSQNIKDKIIVDLNMYDSIEELINFLNTKLELDFKKSIYEMSAFDLKKELEDLKIKSYDAKINFIFFYKNNKSVLEIDQHKKLDLLLRLLSDVKVNQNIESENLLLTLIKTSTKSTLDLFEKYSTDIKDSINDVIKFIGKLPTYVISEFPNLISIFENIANKFKTNELMINWANDNNENILLNNLDHILVKFIINSPH